jgi:hypothetical protein
MRHHLSDFTSIPYLLQACRYFPRKRHHETTHNTTTQREVWHVLLSPRLSYIRARGRSVGSWCLRASQIKLHSPLLLTATQEYWWAKTSLVFFLVWLLLCQLPDHPSWLFTRWYDRHFGEIYYALLYGDRSERLVLCPLLGALPRRSKGGGAFRCGVQ